DCGQRFVMMGIISLHKMRTALAEGRDSVARLETKNVPVFQQVLGPKQKPEPPKLLQLPYIPTFKDLQRDAKLSVTPQSYASFLGALPQVPQKEDFVMYDKKTQMILLDNNGKPRLDGAAYQAAMQDFKVKFIDSGIAGKALATLKLDKNRTQLQFQKMIDDFKKSAVSPSTADINQFLYNQTQGQLTDAINRSVVQKKKASATATATDARKPANAGTPNNGSGATVVIDTSKVYSGTDPLDKSIPRTRPQNDPTFKLEEFNGYSPEEFNVDNIKANDENF
ncbi:MAG: hypothetical protein ACXWPM_09830, partial [Bdellovibrionota bacterium]